MILTSHPFHSHNSSFRCFIACDTAGVCAGIASGIVGLDGGRANRVQKGLGIGALGCSALLWLPNYDTRSFHYAQIV